MAESIREKIIRMLVETRNISESDIYEAMEYQKTKKIGLDRALIERGLISEEDLLVLLVRELNIPFINLNKYKIDPSLQELVSERVARSYRVIPLAALDKTLTVALSDPLDIFAMDDLKSITGKEIDFLLTTETEIMKAIDRFYGGQQSVSDMTKDLEVDDFEIVNESEEEEEDDELVDDSEKAPIIRMVNLVVKEAIKQGASDIHMEPMAECMRVRYRIDGVLRDVLEIPRSNQNAIIVRIKIMSQLDITTTQMPQDGRFKLTLDQKEVDFRVSLLPTTFGQKIVMRILDKDNLSVGLDGLGIEAKAREKIEEAIRKPFGMFLITGPTGSGKSTTLYSIIGALNTVDKNIITVEDPVEYLIEGLTQIQARAEIGLTFASGLKAMLRQSPDIVMVGEIRDAETADIAIKASLTGQLVFSTLHTNDSAGALTRLIDMGVEPFLVASSIVMVTAQRLCRKICSKCKEEEKIPKATLERLKYPIKADAKFFHGKGCNYCKQTGYKGRMSITEVLDVDDDIRTMLLKGGSSDEIKNFARETKGMNTLFEDAMQKCLNGLTTLEEVLRVTSAD